MIRKRSLIETVNDQLKNICQVELDPPSLLPKLHYQSVIGFGCFLLFRQKALHQHRPGVCTSLFPAGCLGRTRVIIGIEDAAAALHEKAVDRTIEKILRCALRLHHDRETVDLTDLVVLAFGARFLRDLL